MQNGLRKFKVVVEQDDDGKFVAQCPALPGCISEGAKREDAVANIKDAIEGYLASLKKHDEPILPSSTKKLNAAENRTGKLS